jgi:hypothetical protein
MGDVSISGVTLLLVGITLELAGYLSFVIAVGNGLLSIKWRHVGFMVIVSINWLME